MPHIVIECSKDVEAQTDLQALCETLVDRAAKDPAVHGRASLKARAIPVEYSYAGADTQNFAHVTLWLLEGRSQDDLKRLKSALLDELEMALPEVGSLSVNHVEMQTATYMKRIK